MQITSFTILVLALTANALPIRREGLQSRQDDIAIQNGQDAIDLNEKFKTLTVDAPCTTGEDACIDGQFAKCDAGNKFSILGCAAGTVCAAIPLENQRGTLVNCVRQEDVNARIRATGALEDRNNNRRQSGRGRGRGRNRGGNNNNNAGGAAGGDAAAGDAAAGGNGANNAAGNGADNAADNAAGNGADNAANNAAGNGADNAANNAAGNGADNAANNAAGNGADNAADNAAGNGGNNNAGGAANDDDPQTSTTLNPDVIAPGFANDGQDVPAEGQVASLTSTNNFINFCLGKTLTNGQQIVEGSCNPAPMGDIPAKARMPSSKFTEPKNGATVPANQPFDVKMAIKNLETGNFVNAQQNYFAAPQQLNAQGIIRGHSHVVIELLEALDQTTPLDPEKFAFFKGLNSAAVDGILTATVDDGLPAGFYRLSSINTASNHQPVLVPVAQHGSLDDVIYFTVE
ncbi:hypothetical protein BJ165DRAFT_1522337 [Panaeolus papilionaceus]|nr:hypothetical protein BJ165DRAFT_1522337 [Panaeolus papilionaceus]